jgi:hypothetical protein
MAGEYLLVAGALGLFTIPFLASARGAYNRSKEIAALADERTAGDEDTVEGTVTVTEPADPGREPPDGPDGGVGTPALWAWRVQEEHKRPGGQGGAEYSWETLESGLAVGEFAIEDGWDEVRVDPTSLPPGTNGQTDGGAGAPSEGNSDPIESDQFHFEDPEIEQYLGEPGLLDSLGGDFGPFEDVEFRFNVGSETSARDRYQAAVIEEGDELFVRGVRERAGDDELIRGTDDTPLVLAEADLEAKAGRMRKKARNRVAIAGVMIAFAAVLLARPLVL